MTVSSSWGQPSGLTMLWRCSLIVSRRSDAWKTEVIFFTYLKALVNEDTLLRTHCCRHKCFPVCPRAQHLLRTQNFFPGHKKCFWFCSETFCVRNKCFPVCAAQETSCATMCPQQCVLVYQGLYVHKGDKGIEWSSAYKTLTVLCSPRFSAAPSNLFPNFFNWREKKTPLYITLSCPIANSLYQEVSLMSRIERKYCLISTSYFAG